MSLNLSSRLTYSAVPAKAVSDLVLQASIVAQEQDPEKKRNPIDLVIVLDKSGSMSGDKLALCIKTLEFLIQEALSDDDFLGLVTFDSTVTVDYRGAKMTKENRQVLLDKVRRINAGSCTNLSGGLFAGLDLLKENSKADVSAICLLTDGMMNEGVTSREELVKITKDMIFKFPQGKAKPSVFTFGYGTDADAGVMKLISEATGGTYYSIVNPESVPISFADCLGGLMAVAAQTVQLSCEVSGGGAEIMEALTSFPTTKLSSTSYQISIKDMYCGEHRDILFKLKLPLISNDGLPSTEIRLTLKYMDTLHEVPQTTSSASTVTRYAGADHPTTPPDVEVTRHLMRIEAAKAMEEARLAAEAGNLDQGRSHVNNIADKMNKTMQMLGISEESDAMMTEVMSDLKEASSNLRSKSVYQQFGSAQMQSAAMSHAYQRSNKVDSMMSSADAIDKSAYAQASKKSMMKSAKQAFGF